MSDPAQSSVARHDSTTLEQSLRKVRQESRIAMRQGYYWRVAQLTAEAAKLSQEWSERADPSRN